MVPRAVERLRALDAETFGDDADELERIYAEYIEGVEREFTADDQAFAAYVSMPADDWRQVVGSLGRLYDEEGLRVWWLRKKLVKRLRERLEQMED
jgi:hypothetical protein